MAGRPALAAAKVPVLMTALDNLPTSFAALGSRQENAALLRRAGVPVAVTAGDGETFNVRTSSSTRATPSPTACRGTRRCAP